MAHEEICSKIKYKDKIQAMFILSQCRKSNKAREKLEKRCYYCKKCKAWYLTSEE